MNVTVINTNTRRGSTWHCMDLFLKELGAYGEVNVTQFTLPRDMPQFCRGCFSCFYKGENTCPDAQYIAPIVKSMEESDIIILTSPVYALSLSGQMKALLDHLCFMWASHRPNPKMFGKVGVVFTTTAGMGMGRSAGVMKSSLNFWGLKRILVFKGMVSAMKWDDVKEEKKAKVLKTVKSMAKKAAAAVEKKHGHRLAFRFMFSMMRGMQKKNDWNATDRAHWESQGWLDGKSPFKA